MRNCLQISARLTDLLGAARNGARRQHKPVCQTLLRLVADGLVIKAPRGFIAITLTFNELMTQQASWRNSTPPRVANCPSMNRSRVS